MSSYDMAAGAAIVAFIIMLAIFLSLSGGM